MKKLTKAQREIIQNLNPRCEDCHNYQRWNETMMCFAMSPFISSKETQRLRPAGTTLNCGIEGCNFRSKQ